MAIKKGSYWFGYARQVVQGFSQVSDSSVSEASFWVAPFACKIVKAGVIFDTAVTGTATNNFGLRFKNKGAAGSGTAVIATLTFASGTDGGALDYTDFGACSNNILQEGDTVSFEKFVNGDGLTQPALTAVIEFVRHR